MGTVLFDSPSESPGMFLFDSNHITVATYLYVGWKRDYDHPTTFFYAKNSWKSQKGFFSLIEKLHHIAPVGRRLWGRKKS